MNDLFWQIPAAGAVTATPVIAAHAKERYGEKLTDNLMGGGCAVAFVGFWWWETYRLVGWWGPIAWCAAVALLAAVGWYLMCLRNMWRIVRPHPNFRWYHWITLPFWLAGQMILSAWGVSRRVAWRTLHR